MKLNSKLVVIKVDQPKAQNDSGVFIQEEWKTQQPTGTIEAIAEDVTFCKPGDRVQFERYSATRFVEGEDLRLCREDAIQVIL